MLIAILVSLIKRDYDKTEAGEASAPKSTFTIRNGLNLNSTACYHEVHLSLT
jgi:hypothetical protein